MIEFGRVNQVICGIVLALACAFILGADSSLAKDSGRTSESSSDSHHANGVRLGILGGVGFSRLGGHDPSFSNSDLQTKSGLLGGAFVRLPLSRTFAIEPQVLYIAKGYNWGGAMGVEESVDTKYVEVPVLVSAIAYSLGPFRPKISAGPYFAFLLASKAGARQFSSSTDLKSVTNSSDWGVCLGAGLDLPIGRGLVTIDVRYEVSLKDLWRGGTYIYLDGSRQTIPPSPMKLRSVCLMAGFCY